GAGILGYLLTTERRPCPVLARGIADARRELPDDHDDLVATPLEVPQLLQDDRMTEVEVGRRGVEAKLHDERSILAAGNPEFGPKAIWRDHLHGTGFEIGARVLIVVMTHDYLPAFPYPDSGGAAIRVSRWMQGMGRRPA